MHVLKAFWRLVFIIALSLPVSAFASGECSSCHTMHNSQAGGFMGTSTLNNYLLVASTCLGCHTGTNSAGSTPYVLDDSGEPTNSSLAGGNFYWVALGATYDPQGHNVAGAAVAADSNLTTAPGGTFSAASQMTCAGTTGCHGDRTIVGDFPSMSGTHHNNAAGLLTPATATAANSYRFLKGVHGLEASDYELNPTAASHNEYKGTDRALETADDASTISSLCADCHSNFHNGNNMLTPSGSNNMVSPWIRHPTDFDMNNVSAKADYTSITTYSNITPVARGTLSTPSSSTIMNAAGDAVIMCLSCHRAHGSGNDSILRWDYKGWPGNGEVNGCNECHTTKD